MHIMKVTRNLQITAKEFFDAIFEELVQEIEKLDHQKISKESLKTGFHYHHKGKDAYSNIDFEIVEYEEEKIYNSVRTSFNGTTSIRYEVSSIENGITVTFTHESNEHRSQKKQPKIISMFTEAYELGRMTDKLYSYQKKVINEKEGFEEKDFGSPLLPNIRKKK